MVRPKPFLKNDEAKKDFMIVMPAGSMLLEEFAHARRTKILKDPRTTVKQCISHPVVDGTAEPIIYDVDSKAALRS